MWFHAWAVASVALERRCMAPRRGGRPFVGKAPRKPQERAAGVGWRRYPGGVAGAALEGLGGSLTGRWAPESKQARIGRLGALRGVRKRVGCPNIPTLEKSHPA